MEALQHVLERDPRIAYAMLFGSGARGQIHTLSDFDVAVGLTSGSGLSAAELGALVADLEQASGRPVDLVLLDEAPPALAYRIFSEGTPLVVRDRQQMVARKTRAILDYLDFRPIEQQAIAGVLAAAARG